jgi:hypothetical protein
MPSAFSLRSLIFFTNAWVFLNGMCANRLVGSALVGTDFFDSHVLKKNFTQCNDAKLGCPEAEEALYVWRLSTQAPPT